MTHIAIIGRDLIGAIAVRFPHHHDFASFDRSQTSTEKPTERANLIESARLVDFSTSQMSQNSM